MSDSSQDQKQDVRPDLGDERFLLPRERAIRAAYRGDRDLLESLLDDGYDVNEVSHWTGMAALHVAVGRDDLGMVKLLVERGASFFPDQQGRWPSAIAALCEVSEELCDYIAEAEAAADDV